MNADGIRSQLADLSALQARTDADERKILAAAEKRHDDLQKQMAELKKDAILDVDGAAARYLAMTDELGQVSIVIAKAREALGE